MLRVAIEYLTIIFVSALIALAYMFFAGAAFLPALLVGLLIVIVTALMAEIIGRQQLLRNWTVVLLVVTWVVLLAVYRFG